MTEKDFRQFNGQIAIGDLYPELSPDEQAEAEYHLLRYLRLVRRIFERIRREKPELLTELERRAMLRKERQKSARSAAKNRFFKF
jgi:hypothetical protein